MKPLLLTLLFTLFSCKHINSQNTKVEISENSGIEKILEKQLKQGLRATIGDAVDYQIEYSINDLEVEGYIVQDILIGSGYKKISNENFSKKIEIVFKRILDYSSSKPYIYINNFNMCDRNTIFFQNNLIDYNGFFIFKNYNFIAPLYTIPELLDYQSKYPEIKNFEKKIPIEYLDSDGDKISIQLWKDEKDLPNRRYFNEQLLVNRNKYLFNENKASLVWLKFNDEYFLESLVKTFGYTKDKDLLDWVMKRNEAKAKEFINNYLFVRNCKGELEIREDILKYIEEHTTDDEKTQNYVKELGSYQFENDNNWNEQEIFKITAYLANTYDFLFKKSENLGNTNKGRISYLGSIFSYSFRDDDEKSWKILKQNFEQNNYYNLPHLKEATSDALEFEAFD